MHFNVNVACLLLKKQHESKDSYLNVPACTVFTYLFTKHKMLLLDLPKTDFDFGQIHKCDASFSL